MVLYNGSEPLSDDLGSCLHQFSAKDIKIFLASSKRPVPEQSGNHRIAPPICEPRISCDYCLRSIPLFTIADLQQVPTAGSCDLDIQLFNEPILDFSDSTSLRRYEGRICQ